jgi:hypothetical protein
MPILSFLVQFQILGVAGRAVLNVIADGVTNVKDPVKFIKTKVKAVKNN